MQPTLLSKVHALYDRVVHGAKSKADAAPARRPVRDSPSQRITRPMSTLDEDATLDEDGIDADAGEMHLRDERDVEPMSAPEQDDSDRADGENWTESAVEHAIDTLPAGRPLIIDDEPTTRHDH
ncbi:MAG: hypothetical protein ABJE66_25105 [Deltaproteobacteria bacterium]